MASILEKLKSALAIIASYTENKKPINLGDAEGMLAVINVIAGETLEDIKTDHLGRPINEANMAPVFEKLKAALKSIGLHREQEAG